MKININTTLGVTAMLISLGTLVVLIYQSQLMREHEEKSAIPKLELWNDFAGGRYGLTLINKGLGPALIEKVNVEFEGQSYDIDPMFFSKEYADSTDFDVSLISGSHLFEGIIISPGAKVILVESINDQDDEMLRYLFYENRAKAIVHYSSFYGKVWRIKGVGDLPNVQKRFEPKIFNELFDD